MKQFLRNKGKTSKNESPKYNSIKMEIQRPPGLAFVPSEIQFDPDFLYFTRP